MEVKFMKHYSSYYYRSPLYDLACKQRLKELREKRHKRFIRTEIASAIGVVLMEWGFLFYIFLRL